MGKWKPKLGETYYFVTHWLRVSKSSWADWSGEKWLLEEGNCFRTEQEAEAKLEKIKAIFKDQQITEHKSKLTAEIFDREDCPTWARYAAVNADGKVALFSNNPSRGDSQWGVTYYSISVNTVILDDVMYDASDWKNSLIERPKKRKPLTDWVWMKDNNGNCHDSDINCAGVPCRHCIYSFINHEARAAFYDLTFEESNKEQDFEIGDIVEYTVEYHTSVGIKKVTVTSPILAVKKEDSKSYLVYWYGSDQTKYLDLAQYKVKLIKKAK